MKEPENKRVEFATLSLDLDNQWSYMKTHGDAGWDSFPSYLELVIPRILGILEELDVRITFFVVGKDAQQPENRDALRLIAEAGHEIGNHSFWHEPWFHRYDRQETEEEVAAAEEAIWEATGVRPRAWRGPGFSSSPVLLEILKEREYAYDASSFPTCIGPLARAYYLATSNLNRGEKEKRSGLYGSWKDGFGPLRPFWWKLGEDGSLLELPVTTCPFLRTPMHASYLHYLATFNRPVSRLYLQTSLTLCRWRGITPSFLLHPTDFLGREDVPELAYFPAMNQPREWKIRQVRSMLDTLGSRFAVLPMGELARELEPGPADTIPLNTPALPKAA